MGRKVPEPVEHAVAKVMKKLKKEKELSTAEARKQAYAIVVGRWQKLGLLKKGTLDLTAKGRKKLSKHYKEPKKERLKKVNMARKKKKKRL